MSDNLPAKLRFCYMGLYRVDFSVNKITIHGLRTIGHTVIECQDTSRGLLKYFRLYRKLAQIKGQYDVIIVGFPGHIMVPFIKYVSSVPVMADLIGSLEDADFYSHNIGLLRRWKNRLIDRLAVACADAVMLESNAQKKHFEQRFGIHSKYIVAYTGADESVFYRLPKTESKNFVVLFRGSLTPESGISYVLQAAEILKADPA